MQNDNTDQVELVLGYVPKDLAYNLSQICDQTHIFTLHSITYDKKINKILVHFDL